MIIFRNHEHRLNCTVDAILTDISTIYDGRRIAYFAPPRWVIERHRIYGHRARDPGVVGHPKIVSRYGYGDAAEIIFQRCYRRIIPRGSPYTFVRGSMANLAQPVIMRKAMSNVALETSPSWRCITWGKHDVSHISRLSLLKGSKKLSPLI